MLNKDQQGFVDQLIAKMSLAQKIGQMTMTERMHVTPAEVKQFGLGSVLSGGGSHPGENTPSDWIRMNDEFWQAAMGDEDSPGIPILFAIDAVHGHNNVKGATIFPHNISFGAAGDVDLVGRVASATASEILATGVEWNFAPTLAVVQNCQWGRTYESFGADSALIGKFGEAYVSGLQSAGVIGCVKHWVGDGGTAHGIDQGETTLTWEELESVHVSPYYPALDAGVMSVMVSFNSWNGEKCHGSYQLVTELLKDKLGFEGVVVSDWDGIDYLDEDYDAAIRKSVCAGLDVFMVPEKWREFYASLLRQVENGEIPESRIDDAVRRIISVKTAYGLFDLPRPAERETAHNDRFGSAAHRDLAREVVRKSLVLLKNEDNLLPLAPDLKILVAGKSADHIGHQCGGWSISWQGEKEKGTIEGTSIWEGIESIFPNAVLSQQGDGMDANPEHHDVAIVVIGETPYAEGFGDIRFGDEVLIETGSMIDGLMNPLEPYAQTLELAQIHPEDLNCIESIRAKGIPVLTILVSGRPLVINEELAASTAFVAAWLPGSEGLGVAEVLSGQHAFSGRLPLAWPASDTSPNSDRSSGEILFPAGYGMNVLAENLDSVVKLRYKD